MSEIGHIGHITSIRFTSKVSVAFKFDNLYERPYFHSDHAVLFVHKYKYSFIAIKHIINHMNLDTTNKEQNSTASEDSTQPKRVRNLISVFLK